MNFSLNDSKTFSTFEGTCISYLLLVFPIIFVANKAFQLNQPQQIFNYAIAYHESIDVNEQYYKGGTIPYIYNYT